MKNTRDRSYDVIVIGGGFSGTAITYYLARLGVRTLLLEAKHICSGTSGACAGRAQIIESETETYLELVGQGFQRLSTLGAELDLDLEWDLPGHLSLLRNEKQWVNYRGYIDRLVRHGIAGEMLDRHELQNAEPNICLRDIIGASYSQEGHLNPFKFCMGFAQAARRRGAVITSHAQVREIKNVGGGSVILETNLGEFFAQKIVVACGAWSKELLQKAGMILPLNYTHAEAMVSEPLSPLIHHHIGMPGFYEAVHGGSRTVTLGVGQHRSGTLVISNAIQPADAIDTQSTCWGMPAIAEALVELLPLMNKIRIVRTWAAPSPFLPDYLPAIGWMPGSDNVYIAAGFHLAIPTIPMLSEQIACDMFGSGDGKQLLPFSPNRFMN